MKRAAISRAIRMKRAHDENISFCPASGSAWTVSVMTKTIASSSYKRKISTDHLDLRLLHLALQSNSKSQ